mmetsp:Transcript_26339/g.53695  ORF Transcript_26339/g.53695 Transcript_26339/m.53695 type:complete len:374 (+) Transcript_26339:52-1173(+)
MFKQRTSAMSEVDTAVQTRRKFRMVALDLDGTLLDSNHEISDSTCQYLRKLHDKGFIVSIATGRSAACTAHIIDKLNLSPLSIPAELSSGNKNSGGFPLVCTNGARGLRVLRKTNSEIATGLNKAVDKAPRRSSTEPIPSLNNDEDTDLAPTNLFLNETIIVNEELFHSPLSSELTFKTLALAHKMNCVTNYYHNHNIYAVVRNGYHMELTKRYAKLTGSEELYRYLNVENSTGDDAVMYNNKNVYGYQKAVEHGLPSKLLILCDTEQLDEVTSRVRLELNGSPSTIQAHVIRGSPPFFVEILDPHVNKGRGLQLLCESLSVPLEEVIAFGDGDNDLEFIQMAGRGVAMKNARDSLKKVADEVGEWTNHEVRK